jgi:hypothetical protein
VLEIAQLLFFFMDGDVLPPPTIPLLFILDE